MKDKLYTKKQMTDFAKFYSEEEYNAESVLNVKDCFDKWDTATPPQPPCVDDIVMFRILDASIEIDGFVIINKGEPLANRISALVQLSVPSPTSKNQPAA